MDMNNQQNQRENRISSSSASSESQILPSLSYYHLSMKPISSFQQVNFLNYEELQPKLQPLCIIYQSPYSIIVKCKKLSNSSTNSLQESEPQQNNQYYAVKLSNSASKQTQILQKIHQTNLQCWTIVKNQCFCTSSFVMKYYQCSLRIFLFQNQFIFEPVFILNLFKSCVNMLQCLQRGKIIHGDIKPDNILVQITQKRGFNFVLTDFSHSFSFGDLPERFLNYEMEESQNVMSEWSFQYTAPELVQDGGDRLNYEKVDIWGVGALLFQIITTQSLFPFETNTLKKYKQWSPEYLSKQNILGRLKQQPYATLKKQNFYELVQKMLEQDPRNRINLNEVSNYCKKLMIKYSI